MFMKPKNQWGGSGGERGTEERGVGQDDTVITEAIKASKSPSAFLPVPGGTPGQRCLVPHIAIMELLARGFIFYSNGSHQWSTDIDEEFQAGALVEAMPDSPQKSAIADLMGVKISQISHSACSPPLSGSASPRASPDSLAQPSASPRTSPAASPTITSPDSSPQPSPIQPKALNFGGGQCLGQGALFIKISAEVKKWQKPTEEQLMEREMIRKNISWPGRPGKLDSEWIEMADLYRYFRRVCKKEGTYHQAVRGSRYFFSLFSFAEDPQSPPPSTKLDLVIVFTALYKRKLIADVMDLDVFHPSVSWSRYMYEALCKMVNYIFLAAEDKDDKDGMSATTSCKIRYLTPLKDKLKEQKELARLARNNVDIKRIAALPSIAEMNTSCRSAMLDLKILHDHYLTTMKENPEGLPRLVRRAMNTLVYGIMAYRTYPGRPGEWGRMLQKVIIECLDDPNRWFVIITDHKTYLKRGPLGRYMPPDVKWACRMLLDFKTRGRRTLFEPTNQADTVQIHRLAHQFAQMYTPGKQAPEPTLMRKFVETVTAERRNQEKAKKMKELVEQMGTTGIVSKLTADMSGHSLVAQKNNYDLNSADPELHAASSKAYIEVFVGPPLDIPTEEDVRARPDKTASAIISEFAERTSLAHSGNESADSVFDSTDDDSEREPPNDPVDAAVIRKEEKKKEKKEKKTDKEPENIHLHRGPYGMLNCFYVLFFGISHIPHMCPLF